MHGRNREGTERKGSVRGNITPAKLSYERLYVLVGRADFDFFICFENRAQHTDTLNYSIRTCIVMFCHFFVCFRTHLFVRALLDKMLSKEVEREGRPDTVVEVWARSVHSGARGRRSKFFTAGGDKCISRGFCVRTCSFSYVLTTFKKG